MTYVPNSGALVPEFTLAADWTNTSTITVSYPTGSAQGSFTNGLSVPNKSFMIANRNDKTFEDTTGATGITLSFGASNVTVTNKTGATIPAGTVLSFWFDQQDGNNIEWLHFAVSLASVAAGDYIAAFPAGVDGFIEQVEYMPAVAATTAAKLATLTPKINTTALTGGVLALTTTNCGTVGVRAVGTQVTAANRITKKDTITVTGSAVTAFVEGSGTLSLRIRLDTL